MLHVTYYHPHYYKCLGIQQGGNTSLLSSVAMYPDNRGAEENGAVTTLEWRPATKEDHLLSGSIDDAGGIYNKLWRWTEKQDTESLDTSDNVKAKILKCLQKHR